MADLPPEIMVWESSPDLHHIGTWATTRYPREAVAYVPKADAAAAQALMVERAVAEINALIDDGGVEVCCGAGVGGYDGKSPPECCGRPVHTITGEEAVGAILRLAPDAGTAELAKLQAERDAGWTEAKYQEAERDTLAASLAAQTALVETLRAYLDTLPDGPVSGEVIDTICGIAHGNMAPARAAIEAIEAAEVATMTPEQRALYRASMDMRAGWKKVAEEQANTETEGK